MEGIYGHIIIDVPGFRIARYDFTAFRISNESFKAVHNKGDCERVVGDAGIDTVRLVIEYKGHFLCACSLFNRSCAFLGSISFFRSLC